MSMEERHLSPDELLSAVEQIEGDSPHLARCGQCRGELEGFRSVIALLRQKWHPGSLDLPAAHQVLTTARGRYGLRWRLISTTVGWFLLLAIAAGLVCIWESFMPQIARTLGALHSAVGTAGIAALIMLLLGIASSPAVVLLGDSRAVERSFPQ